MSRNRCSFFAQRILSGLLLLGLWMPVLAVAGEMVASKEELKAGFIYNFMQFIEWPENSFAEPDGALVLCVYGDCSFDDCLDELQDREVKGRPVRVIHADGLSDIPKCHMLFVPKMNEEKVKNILSRLPWPAPVTVGEQDGFAEMGGAINLFIGEGKRLGFEVNVQASADSGVKISSRLLRLAVLIPSGERSRTFWLPDERYAACDSTDGDDSG